MTDLSALYEHWSFSINNLPNIRLKINFELFAEAKPQKVCLNLNAGTGLKGEAINTKYSISSPRPFHSLQFRGVCFALLLTCVIS